MNHTLSSSFLLSPTPTSTTISSSYRAQLIRNNNNKQLFQTPQLVLSCRPQYIYITLYCLLPTPKRPATKEDYFHQQQHFLEKKQNNQQNKTSASASPHRTTPL